MIYISHPTEINAHKFEGFTEELMEWLKAANPTASHYSIDMIKNTLEVKPTTGEWLVVREGYFIIEEMGRFKGIYPCNPIIFAKKYTKKS